MLNERLKNFSVILLLAIYSVSISGIGVRQFYCCGRLKSTSIGFVKQFKGDCAGAKKMKGCCKTRFYTLEVKDKHQKSVVDIYTGNDMPVAIIHDAPSRAIVPFTRPVKLHDQDHAPPGGSFLCILYADLRI